MNDWIETTFSTSTNEDEREVFVFASGESRVEARLDIFLTIFSEVEAPPTTAGLKAADPEDAAGWHRHFDAWAERGIVPADGSE